MATRTKHALGWVAGICLVAVIAVGCSDDKGADESGSTGDTTGTTVASKSSSNTKTTTTEHESSDTTISKPAAGVGGEETPWTETAAAYRGQDGTQVTIDCAPEGTARSIWGTETYTDDSSICTAAVHAGLITVASGGTVTIEITAGADAYEGTDANEVSSGDYGAWGGSFVFVASAN